MDAALQFDDTRILRDEVGPQERSRLEHTLLRMFLSRAKAKHIPVSLVQDAKFYEELKVSQTLFDTNHFYLFVDDKKNVRDMTPVAYHLLDTDEGLFYAKLMQFGGRRRI